MAKAKLEKWHAAYPKEQPEGWRVVTEDGTFITAYRYAEYPYHGKLVGAHGEEFDGAELAARYFRDGMERRTGASDALMAKRGFGRVRGNLADPR